MAENGGNEKAAPVDSQPVQTETKETTDAPKTELKIENVPILNLLSEKKDETEAPPVVENSPRPQTATPVRSRVGSIVSFSLPPNQDGKPQPYLFEEPGPSGELQHTVSPAMSPQGEKNPDLNPLRRSSFDAIPFTVHNDTISQLLGEFVEEKKSPEPQKEEEKSLPKEEAKTPTKEEEKKPAEEVVHHVSREESNEMIRPPISTSPEIPPEEFHPVSPQSSENTQMDIPLQIPSEPEELKQSLRSTFEAIAFSDAEESEYEENNYAEASNQTDAGFNTDETIYIPLAIEMSEPQFHILNEINENIDDKSVEIPTLTEAVEEQLKNSQNDSQNKTQTKSNQSSRGQIKVIRSRQSSNASQNNNQNSEDNQSNNASAQSSSRNNSGRSNNSRHPHISRLPLDRISNLNSAATEEAVEEFSQTGRIPNSPHSQRKVASRIAKDREAAIANEDYSKAAEYDELGRKMVEACDKQVTEQYRQEQLDMLQEKLESARQEHQTFREEWDEKIAKIKDSMRDRMRELAERQAQELDDFEAQWNDEDFLRRFSKPSPHLLQLKAQERSMVMTKLFDRAKEYKRMARNVERYDTEQAQKRATSEMKFQKKTLIERHDKELEVMNEKVNQQLDILRRQRDVEEVPYIARVKKLENLYETMKNSGPTQNKNLILIQTGYNSKTARERELPSVRATQRLILSRKEGMAPKLSIKPLGKVLATERKKRTIRVKSATSLK